MIDQNYKIDGWLVESKLGRISRNTKTLQLEPQVMKVLNCLATHAGEVVTKSFLMESLWASPYVSDAALARCISQIRTALGDSRTEPKYIQTVPKIGYRLIANVVQQNSNDRQNRHDWRHIRIAAVTCSLLAIATAGFTWKNHEVAPSTLLAMPLQLHSGSSSANESQLPIDIRVFNAQLDIGLAGIEGRTIARSPNNLDESKLQLNSDVYERGDGYQFEFALLRVGTNESVWEADYHFPTIDIFSISSDVISNVARNLETTVSTDAAKKLGRPRTRDARAHDAFERANRHFERTSFADIKNAASLFKIATTHDPMFADAYAGFAHAIAMEARHWSSNQLDEALQAAERAIALSPKSYTGYHAYGDVQSERGELASARRAYQIALEINPEHTASVLEMANAHFRDRNYSSARKYYLRAVELDPNRHAAKSQLGYLSLNTGDLQQAEQWFEEVISAIPLHMQATLGLASIDLIKGRHISAVARCQHVMEVFPTNYHCLQTSAVANLLHRDLDAAREAFQKMTSAWPNDGYAVLGEAQVLFAENRIPEALDLIDGVLTNYQQRIADNTNCSVTINKCWRDYWIIAASYALKNDRRNAHKWLMRSASAGRRDHFWDKADPVFSTLHGDTEFDAYIATTKIGRQPSWE